MKQPFVYLLVFTALSQAEPSDLASQSVQINRTWALSAFGAGGPPPSDGNQLLLLHEDSPGNTKINLSVVGGPLRLGEKTYSRGIGSNARSELRVRLAQPATRFLADIGLDRNVDESTPASVRFHVAIGGKDVFVTDVIRPKDGARSIDVPLEGAREFDLIMDDGGDARTCDQGDWADARVVLQDGSTVWLDDLSGAASVVPGFPFSFVYGGRPSSGLLPKWKSEIKDEQPDATRQVRTLTLTDPETGLEVKAVANIYLDTPGVDWTIYLTNKGTSDTPVIEKMQAVDVTILPPMTRAKVKEEELVGLISLAQQSKEPLVVNNPILRRLRGTDGCVAFNINDFTPMETPLPIGTKSEWSIPSESAWSSFKEFPFFTLDWGGGGVVTALGWTGQWQAAVDRTGNPIRLTAGMRNLHLKLKPGETIRSPRVLQVYWNGGDQFTGDNLFRRTMLAHITPQLDGKVAFPPLAHVTSAFRESNNTTEEIERSYIESFKNLGFEYYWLDAWWFRGGHPKGIGHWGFPISRVPDTVRFPNGPRPLRDLAASYGMKFLLWFAPESIYADTELAKEHPEWLMKPGPPWGFDLGNPEARDYMTRYMNEAIKAYGIDWWRTDSGPWMERFMVADPDPDRLGMSEIRYVEGLYAFWDAMLAANPGLLLDNCAGGGTRIDLETSARSLSLWRTDSSVWSIYDSNYNDTAILNQSINHGLNRYVPFSQSGAIGAQPYYFRSGYNGGMTYCEDTRTANFPAELLKQGIAEGKRLRKYLTGDFYPLSAATTSAREWCITQYHRPAEADGVVFAFRRHESPFGSYYCELRGIEPDAEYEITRSVGYEPEPARRIKGSELKNLKIDIDDRPGSTVIEYRKINDETP